MSALVAGAAGMVGREVAHALVRRGRFDNLILADVSPDDISVSAGDGVEIARLDVNNGAALGALLGRVDVFVNCTTYHFGVQMLAAAIACGVHYLDLGGLHNTPRQLLHDDAARAAGVSAVIGCGATPGLSNVLARLAADEVGDAREVHVSFASFRDLAPSPGLLNTILDEFRPGVNRYYWRHGRLVQVEPFSGGRRVRFPDPVGEQEVYYVPHSENHTLPLTVPTLETVAVRGTWRPGDMAAMKTLWQLGLTSDAPIRVGGAEIAPLALLKEVLLRQGRGVGHGDPAFFLHVAVTNGSQGHALSASHPVDWGAHATGRMTGLPAAVGAELLAAGDVEMTGVAAADAAFDARSFVDVLAEEGIVVQPA